MADLDDEPEKCLGCGALYAYGHICRTHSLCGICHREQAKRREARAAITAEEIDHG